MPDPALALPILAPVTPALMAIAALAAMVAPIGINRLWRMFLLVSSLGLCVTIASLPAGGTDILPGFLRTTNLALVLAVLVQALGVVLAAFSSRYLEGEPGQKRYIAAFSGVLAAVQLLLLADHWVVLIAAWAMIGLILQRLLCFYPDRSFARLAAHKKRIADRLADLLLVIAAALAWREVGSGSLSALWSHVAQHGASMALQASALALVGAVILRTALLPVHGWLIQVMEAPTPVSALLHAGVVNLGGFVLIRFSPLLEASAPAKVLLVLAGLATAVLAGMVLMTRVTIKVRLAWSTTAQMGFMVMQCGLGLYTLAALHLIGHSLYKAHTFLAASDVVRQTRLRQLRGDFAPALSSLLFAPVVGTALVFALQSVLAPAAWPAWWTLILGLAWAPLLWHPASAAGPGADLAAWAWRIILVTGLTGVALLAHELPFALSDRPQAVLGWIAATGMALLYAGVLMVKARPDRIQNWRRWSYAGFYVDEFYTRLALRLWPTPWSVDGHGRGKTGLDCLAWVQASEVRWNRGVE